MADQYNIEIDQGATFLLPINWKTAAGATVDLSSGYTCRMQIRRNYEGEVLWDSSASEELVTPPLNGIKLAATSPNISVHIAPAITAGIKATDRAVYDIELVEDATGQVDRILEGRCKISRNVTR